MKNCRALMSTELISIETSAPIYEAMKLLVAKQVTGLPVVEADGTLAGVITEKDMLRLLYEGDVRNSSVADFMTSSVTSFAPEDSIVDVCECLIQNNFRRVPIIENGKLVGIISRADIIRYILEIRRVDK